MIRKLGHAFVIVALVAAIGGHWAVLQTLAWTNMLARNLQTDSLSEAVAKTFDGRHLCKLCEAVSAGKKAEKKTELSSPNQKQEFISDRPVFVFSPPQDFDMLPAHNNPARALTHRPPVPPPRNLPA